MPRTSASPKGGTFTFRLEPDLKAALARSAADDHKQPAEVVRGLVRDYLAEKARRAFEEEARRQCLAINARAQDPSSDEARVMRELEADLDAFADEWK